MSIRQRSPEWYEARRSLITSTDIAAILGVSPYKSEGDVARSKLDGETEPDDPATQRRFRLGRNLEAAVAAEDEVEHGIKLRRVRRIITDDWRGASLDFERVGERTIVEIKTATSRQWEDGLPQHVEAQVRWQMGVAKYPRAHVAALRFGSSLVCFDVEHDPALFDGLVVVAEDFRRRLAAGGPFSETRESGRRAWPFDSGEEIVADPQTVDAVVELLETRRALAGLEGKEDALVAAIQTRMADASVMIGPGWKVTWKRASDSLVTEWRTIAEGLLATLDDETRGALVSLNTNSKPGARRFILREDKP